MKNPETLLSSARIDWNTPPDLYREICLMAIGRESCDFDLACDESNAKALNRFKAPKAVFDAYAMPQDTKEQKLARRHAVLKAQKESAAAVLDKIRSLTKPHTFWLNPPYGYELPVWSKLANDIAWIMDENDNPVGHTVVMLVPARVDANWYTKFIYPQMTYFIANRVKFSGGKAGAPFPSMFCVLGVKQVPHCCEWVEWSKGVLKPLEETDHEDVRVKI